MTIQTETEQAADLDRLDVNSRPGRAQPIKVLVRDLTVELAPATRYEFALEQWP